jgi:hypothetical protein
VTGQEKTRKKLGGAYPGQRRPANQPYLPPASEFGKDGQAVTHFVAFGGGNALTLVKQDGSHQPEAGKAQSEYIQGTLRLLCLCFTLYCRLGLLLGICNVAAYVTSTLFMFIVLPSWSIAGNM